MPLLRAIMAEPDQTRMEGISGSGMQTRKRRLPEYSDHQIEELVRQLDELRTTPAGSLRTMMTTRGAEDLSRSLPFAPVL